MQACDAPLAREARQLWASRLKEKALALTEDKTQDYTRPVLSIEVDGKIDAVDCEDKEVGWRFRQGLLVLVLVLLVCEIGAMRLMLSYLIIKSGSDFYL